MVATMKTISWSFRLLLLSLVANVMPYPVGIHIGHTYLTSAYYTEANKLIPITRVVANDKWQSFFSETWKDPKNQASLSDTEVASLFRATLQQIETATEEALNKTITINSIVVPIHVGVHTLSTLIQAAIDKGLITEYQQVARSLNADRLAYNLDSCTGFKLLPNESCDLDYTNLVLVINYEPEHLLVAILDVGLYICLPFNIKYYSQFGEISGSILEPARHQELSENLKLYLEESNAEMRKQWSHRDALRYLRAVVLSGEASDLGMEEMRLALKSALPEYQDKFRMSLDPHFVGAFGAAQRARHIVQNPKFLTPSDPGYAPGNPDGHVHEEL